MNYIEEGACMTQADENAQGLDFAITMPSLGDIVLKIY